MGDIKVDTTRIWGTVKMKNGEKLITPAYYNWDYCNKNRMPYIKVYPKTKYVVIDFDLFSIDKGLTFSEDHDFIDICDAFYEDYLLKSGLPKDKVKFSGGGGLSRIFNIYKKDLEVVMEQLFKMIERHINDYGIIDLKMKAKYEEIDRRNKRQG